MDCVLKETRFSDFDKITDEFSQVNDKMYVKCQAGYTENLVNFYMKNGSLNRSQITDTMECFTQSEHTKKLDRLISLAENLLKEVKNSKL
jgi:hypothetical protein